MNKLHPASWATLSFVGALVASTASCAPQTSTSQIDSAQVPATTEAKAESTGGLMAAIDPCTGQIIAPTAAQRDALSQQQSADDARTVTEAEAKASLKTDQDGLIAASMKVPTSKMNHLGAEASAGATTGQHGDRARESKPPAKDELPTRNEDCIDDKNPVR